MMAKRAHNLGFSRVMMAKIMGFRSYRYVHHWVRTTQIPDPQICSACLLPVRIVISYVIRIQNMPQKLI